MAVTYDPPRYALHPLNAIFLAATIPLFLGALLADIAYWKTYDIQWTNFASWLLAGGLVFCALAVVAAAVALFRAPRRGGRVLVYFLLVLAAWVVGQLSAIQQARDAWAAMPAGLVLTLVAVALACAAKWIAFAGLLRTGGTP
jgi:uncharacterized membrane protein